MHNRLCVPLSVGLWSLCLGLSAQDKPQRAGDKFQNVTVLKEMPADQMGKVMNIMSEALGVSCTHCHAGYDFAREDAPHKDASRRMLEMTFKLNQDAFAGRTSITCITCHQGQPLVPDARLSATASASSRSTAAANSPLLTSPTANNPATISSSPPGAGSLANAIDPSESLEAVIVKYRQLVGLAPAGSDGSAKPLTKRTYRGKRLEPSGKEEVEIIQIASPATWQQITHYGQLTVTENYVDGKIDKLAGERSIELKAEEAAQIKIEARLALGLELRSQFSDWQLEPLLSIDERTMQVLQAREGDMIHRFMFDMQSGLLRRRTTTVPTVLGGYVMQVDYEDYRELDGWPVAGLTSIRMPSVRWQRRLESF